MRYHATSLRTPGDDRTGQMLSVSNRFLGTALAGCLVLRGSSVEAQPKVQQVLLLHGSDRGNLVLDSFAGNFRVDLDDRAGRPVNVVQIVIGPTGFVGAPEHAVVDYIRATFADRPKPDLMLTVSGPAAVFARKYRRELFPDTPLLFASVDQRFLGDAPLGEKEMAIAVVNDFPRLVDDILDLLPRTKEVFVVTGSGPIGRFWRRELEDQFQRFRRRVTFVWSDDLSLPEVLRRCSSLPPESAILYVTFGADARGGAYADERVLTDLHTTANAPMFASHSPLLGHGIVGGRLLSIGDLSRSTADVATRILNGAPPGSIEIPPPPPMQPTFDWRELQRWGIAESRLPSGSVVLYRSPTLWQEHKLTVLASIAALGLQSLLIVALMYQRRARRQAESDSQRHLALAADASRRQTMATLTTSIAHELGQPLSAMLHNAEALQMMIDADGVPSDTMREILTDIQTQSIQAGQIIERHRTMLRSHELQKRPIDLHAVVGESLALVAHDLKSRDIETAVSLSSNPCLISGDPVLLQQVLVNLLMNGIDAMAETPRTRRRLTITTAVRATDVEVSVRDAGTGLPPQFEGTLFKPFVTTKPHGLGIGLTIAQTIVNAHGGTIAARNNPEGGATLTFTLRRSKMPESRSASTGSA
jgi:signal transduction histidine kinase